jgi:sugar (pentulose or hexulose) kinase
MSTLRRFRNNPTREEGSLQWNIPELFQQITESLTEVARTQETVNGVSCSSWGEDYMLFDKQGAVIMPVGAPPAKLMVKTLDQLQARFPHDMIFRETGAQPSPYSTLVQLTAEKSRRLSKADTLLPVADGFNYLLSGEARAEASSASATQLYNPTHRGWSARLIHETKLPPALFPQVVPAGTRLGPLRQDIADQTHIEDVEVVTSCSNEMAATLAGIPAEPGENWAFLQMGVHSVLGTELPEPLLTESALAGGFTNEAGYGGAIRFFKPTVGFWILQECRRYWAERGEELDIEMMMHLAGVADPFECLINPAAPIFLTPGDMPQKIKAFCRESGQPIPRKPGVVIRCVLESTALYYRKAVQEMESITGRRINRLYLLGGKSGAKHPLLNNFIANALQVPVVLCPEETTATGNVLVQAIALKHVPSLGDARQLAASTLRCETVHPYAGVWDKAFQKLEALTE